MAERQAVGVAGRHDGGAEEKLAQRQGRGVATPVQRAARLAGGRQLLAAADSHSLVVGATTGGGDCLVLPPRRVPAWDGQADGTAW